MAGRSDVVVIFAQEGCTWFDDLDPKNASVTMVAVV
jgi:hypothetical protein